MDQGEDLIPDTEDQSNTTEGWLTILGIEIVGPFHDADTVNEIQNDGDTALVRKSTPIFGTPGVVGIEGHENSTKEDLEKYPLHDSRKKPN